MLKYILVPATGSPTDAPVFQAALQLARIGGAHLEFLHVRVDVTEVLLSMSAGGVGGGDAVQQVVDRLEAEGRAQERKAWEAFGAFCAEASIRADAPPGSGPTAELVVETGNAGQWIAEYGRFADLVVVGRGGPEGSMADVLESALMDTGRPLLIMPRTPPQRLPGTVVIAWKDAPEAARAVDCAAPLLDAADRVVILSVAEGDDGHDPSCERVRRALRWHNPNTEIRHLVRAGRAPVEVLLEAAHGERADLLVMGGYSHSRLREVVFGGFTQRILGDADIAVLMAH
jgi:nucleotide-binding universal stress UspA family protein